MLRFGWNWTYFGHILLKLELCLHLLLPCFWLLSVARLNAVNPTSPYSFLSFKIAVQLNFPDAVKFTLSGAGVNGTYRALQLHFHWRGANSATGGSEHTVDGLYYEAEVKRETETSFSVLCRNAFCSVHCCGSWHRRVSKHQTCWLASGDSIKGRPLTLFFCVDCSLAFAWGRLSLSRRYCRANAFLPTLGCNLAWKSVRCVSKNRKFIPTEGLWLGDSSAIGFTLNDSCFRLSIQVKLATTFRKSGMGRLSSM